MKYRSEKTKQAAAKYWGKSLDAPIQVRAEESGDELEVLLYDIIGWPFGGIEGIVSQIAQHDYQRITVRINSPGGDVFDGLALYNALRNDSAWVTTRIEGLAASMASIVALAGDEVMANKNAMMMIHEPWAMAVGDQHLLRQVADVLGKNSKNLLDIYYQKTGSDKRKLKQEMEDETWFTAEEAHDRRLIDSVIDEPATKAAFDLSMYNHAPDGVRPEGRDNLTDREIERALRDAGASQSFAKRVVATKVRPQRDAALAELVERIQLLKTAMEN